MAKSKYTEALEKEKIALEANIPFKNKTKNIVNDTTSPSTPYFKPTKKSNSYFNLILGSDYEDLELEIRGLRYVRRYDSRGKEIIELERRPNHYFSEEGAEDFIIEIKGHLTSDIKLGLMTTQEFLMTQEIIRTTLIKWVRKNLERLGMDTESKQRKARPILVMVLNRIRAVYSRSINGSENKRSHGDINLSGVLDGERDSKYKLENSMN